MKNIITNTNRGDKKIVPLDKRLNDRRIKKVITFDTETAPFYEVVKPYETKQETMPYSHQVMSGNLEDVIEEINPRTNRVQYRYMTDTKQKQIIFDFGYVIGDKQGRVLAKRRFIIREVFLNMDIMKHAHYFEKYPDYIIELYDRRNVINLSTWVETKAQLEQDIVDYNITEMYAYNAAFDSRAIRDTHRIITDGASTFGLFKDYQIKINCLWGMACETILQRKKYVEFCKEHGFISESGNIKTSAETVYKYLLNDPDYVEEHTALEDSIIEHHILGECFKAKQKMSFGIISQPWRMVTQWAKDKGYLESEQQC